MTLPSGINDSGQIVGTFGNLDSPGHGFLYTGGSFTTIDVPGASSTAAFGINNSGQIVGNFFDGSTNHRRGFVDTAGSFTFFDVPGAMITYPYGINESGQIVGTFFDSLGQHGFVDTAGSFTTINFPGATRTDAQGINNSGQIVGYFPDEGFLATPVPEPGTLPMILAGCFGFAALYAMTRRAKRV